MQVFTTYKVKTKKKRGKNATTNPRNEKSLTTSSGGQVAKQKRPC